MIENVLAVSSKDQSLAEPIIEGYPAIRAEVIYAIRQEMAATIEDVLARRIGLQLYSWRQAMDAAPGVGLLMARELNWSTSVMDAAINGYVGKIRHLVDSACLSRERSASALQAPSAS
jgi:glycerol-3-phosphate dehydrogenase